MKKFNRKHSHSYQETLAEFEKLITYTIPRNERPDDIRQVHNVTAMNNYLTRLEIDHSKLTFIHVAGTKGKGSTCTFCESILRSKGYKTGLFTSPHLIDIRERIKLNGEPVDKEIFVEHFWKIVEKLDKTRNDMYPSMATYFRLLTCMAFQIFIEEKVDVAIMEVGLGGRLDATNVIQPVVSGITSIGYDHCHILGYTLDKIALEKAGIIKKHIPLVTYKQKGGVIEVFKKKSKEIDAPLIEAPSFMDYMNFQDKNRKSQIALKMLGKHQEKNASLALTLCDIWMKKTNNQELKLSEKKDGLYQYPLYNFDSKIVRGLNQCRLEGRGHVIHFDKKDISFYLDGAHTNESLGLCYNWFEDTVKKKEKSDSFIMKINGSNNGLNLSTKFLENNGDNNHHSMEKTKDRSCVLIFNYTGKRDPAFLLKPVLDNIKFFDYVFLVPLDSAKTLLSKTAKMTTEDKKQLKILHKIFIDNGMKDNCRIYNSIDDCLKWLWKKDVTPTSVLITGSLYLVGDFILKLTLLKSKK